MQPIHLAEHDMTVSDAFIAALPKAELHLHLEGSVSRPLFDKLCQKHGAPVFEAAAQGSGFGTFPDLAAFLRTYDRICAVMRDAEDFRLATYDTLGRSAASGAQYAELFFSPDAHDAPSLSYATMLDGIIAGLADAKAAFGIEARIIPAHNRELGPSRGRQFVEMVLADRRKEVVGIGLDYGERDHPPGPFTEMFAEARRHGLHTTAHAGEDGPSANVRDTIELLGCRRVDHGYHVVDDPELMDRCRELDILFTVCPTTTLHTTPWRDLDDPGHAIRRMIEGGLRVTIATDDPAIFDTTLNREYRLLADAFALTEEALAAIAANGFSHNWHRTAGERYV